MSFGTRLKELRKSKGFTQEALAKALGVTKGAIGNYETDASSPKEEILLKIFKVLDAEPNYLFQDSLKEMSIKLDIDEKDIIDKYRETDEYGRETVRFTVNREYKRTKEQQQKEQSKNTNNLIDNELERMKDQQLINIPAVARRQDYSEPFELNLTKEQIERIKNAPAVTSDDDL